MVANGCTDSRCSSQMDSESYNPKQAREQKVRRDRRRKDNRRPDDAPSNVERESISSAPKGQRESSGRIRERRPTPAAEPKKPANEETSAENKEPPELPDFSNLKRETDEIAALTSKKYSKRQIFSNWAKYENSPEVHVEEEDDDDGRRADFESLVHLPATAGGHFKFKSEHSWDVNPSSLYAEYFSVNVESLAQGLSCIPLYDKLELPKSLLSAEELERIEYFAKQSSARYNVTKASLKEGTHAQDANNHINKILNILSYKENQASHKTDPSMYENVDEDDQLENKSLVQFSFETNSAEQGSASVEVCIPATRSLSSRNSTPGKETEPPVQANVAPVVTKDLAEPPKIITSHSQSNGAVASALPVQNHVRSVIKEERTEITPTTNAVEENVAQSRHDYEEVPHDSATVWEEEKLAVEEPVVLEQRTGRGKKGSAKGKHKKDEKKGKSEENNNFVDEKVAVVESADVVSNSCTRAVQNMVVAEAIKPPVGRTVTQFVVEDETKKINVKSSEDFEKPSSQGKVVGKESAKPKVQGKVVEKESEKPELQGKVVEKESVKPKLPGKSHVKESEKPHIEGKTDKGSNKPLEQEFKKAKADTKKKNPRVDDELDFLLSLKKPVEDVKPKIAPPSQVVRSAIDEDEADSALLLVTKNAEEDLEDWLDSMLED